MSCWQNLIILLTIRSKDLAPKVVAEETWPESTVNLVWLDWMTSWWEDIIIIKEDRENPCPPYSPWMEINLTSIISPSITINNIIQTWDPIQLTNFTPCSRPTSTRATVSVLVPIEKLSAIEFNGYSIRTMMVLIHIHICNHQCV